METKFYTIFFSCNNITTHGVISYWHENDFFWIFFQLLPPSILWKQELWQRAFPIHLHKPLHQTHHLIGYYFSLLPLSLATLLFLTPMDLNILSLLLVLTLTILQQKKKKKQSRMPINSCQTFTKRQISFEEKEVQFNCKAYFSFFLSVPCVMMVIEHICNHCWFSFFMLLYTLVDCYQHPSTFPSFFTITGKT